MESNANAGEKTIFKGAQYFDDGRWDSVFTGPINSDKKRNRTMFFWGDTPDNPWDLFSLEKIVIHSEIGAPQQRHMYWEAS